MTTKEEDQKRGIARNGEKRRLPPSSSAALKRKDSHDDEEDATAVAASDEEDEEDEEDDEEDEEDDEEDEEDEEDDDDDDEEDDDEEDDDEEDDDEEDDDEEDDDDDGRTAAPVTKRATAPPAAATAPPAAATAVAAPPAAATVIAIPAAAPHATAAAATVIAAPLPQLVQAVKQTEATKPPLPLPLPSPIPIKGRDYTLAVRWPQLLGELVRDLPVPKWLAAAEVASSGAKDVSAAALDAAVASVNQTRAAIRAYGKEAAAAAAAAETKADIELVRHEEIRRCAVREMETAMKRARQVLDDHAAAIKDLEDMGARLLADIRASSGSHGRGDGSGADSPLLSSSSCAEEAGQISPLSSSSSSSSWRRLIYRSEDIVSTEVRRGKDQVDQDALDAMLMIATEAVARMNHCVAQIAAETGAIRQEVAQAEARVLYGGLAATRAALPLRDANALSWNLARFPKELSHRNRLLIIHEDNAALDALCASFPK